MLSCKKTQIKVWLLTVVATATIVIGVLPQATINAAATYKEVANGSHIDNTLSGQVLDHQLLYWLLSCYAQSDVDRAPADQVKGWEFLDYGEAVRGDMYSNARANCGNPDYVKEAWGRFGFTNSEETFCSLSFAYNKDTGGLGKPNKQGESPSQLIKDCLAGVAAGADSDGAGGAGNSQVNAVRDLLKSSPKYAAAASDLSPAAEYIRYYLTFANGCNISIQKDLYDTGSDLANNKSKYYKVPIVDPTGVITDHLGSGGDNGNDGDKHDLVATVATGSGVDASQQKTCGELVTSLRGGLSDAYSAYLKDPANSNNTGVTPGATNTDGDGEQQTCESSGFFMSWLICGIIDLSARAADGAFSLISKILDTDPLVADQSNTTYKAWSNFRIYGNVLLVIALLVIVFGEAIGGGLIDAYNVKKILPRILTAAILINISFYLVALANDFANILGKGMSSLITTPFDVVGSAIQIGDGDGLALLIGSVGTAWAVGGVAFGTVLSTQFLAILGLFVVLPAILIAIGILVTVFLRQALIIFLVVVSPVAFALYCLPNTEKYFRQWWDALFKALIVYPIIAVLFALSKVMGVIISQGPAGPLLAIMAFLAPLFLIPFAFKLAGGVLGRALDLASNTGKRMGEGIKGNANDANSLRNKTKGRFAERYTRMANRRLSDAKSPDASRSKRARARVIGTADGRINERMSRYNKHAADLKEMIASTGNDDDHFAAVSYVVKAGDAAPAGTTSTRGGSSQKVAGSVESFDRTFDAKGRERSASYAASSRRALAGNDSESGSMLEYVGRKIQTDDDMANFREAFKAVAVRENLSGGEAAGIQAQSLFAHKDKFPEFYHEQPKIVKDASGKTTGVTWDSVSSNTVGGRKNRNGMVGELHKSKAGFQLSSLRDGTLRSWNDDRNRIQTEMDSGQAVSYEDAEFYTMTNELLDSMVQRQLMSADGTAGAELSSSVSAAGVGVLKSMMTNRRYEQRAVRNPDGTSSVNERELYEKPPALPVGVASPFAPRAVNIATPSGPVTGNPNRVHSGTSVAVTGDSQRSSIKTSI